MKIKTAGQYINKSGDNIRLLEAYTTDTATIFVGYYEGWFGLWNNYGDCLWMEGTNRVDLWRFDIFDLIKTDTDEVSDLKQRLERLEEKLIFD